MEDSNLPVELIRKNVSKFVQVNFETGRPPGNVYEHEKQILNKYRLSANEIQSERKEAARRCEI